MLPSVVYKLNSITDDSRFDSFFLTGGKSERDEVRRLLDFDRNDFPRRFAERGWNTLKVTGWVGESDYPCIEHIRPAFSSRAVDCLREFLDANGEVLPLSVDDGVYYYYNITTFSDSLEVSKSDCIFPHGESRPAVGIRYFSFNQNQLHGHSIFRIPQFPGGVFVTESFVSVAKDRGLRGLEFTKVWPFKEGTKWNLAKEQIVLD